MIEEAVEKIRVRLDKVDSVREEIIRKGRDAVRLARKAVFSIHEGDLEKGGELAEECGRILVELGELAASVPEVEYSGVVLNSMSECFEAIMFWSYASKRVVSLPPLWEKYYVAFLWALADLAGEVKRLALTLLLRGEVERARECARFIRRIYTLLSSLDYPEALVPGIRRKVDRIRHLLEGLEEQVLFASKAKEVREAVSRLVED